MEVRTPVDTEFKRQVVCLGADCVEHSWGGIADLGIRMDVGFFAGVREMRERDVYDVAHGLTAGAEYRGIRSDGTYFRWVGVIGERIAYDDVSMPSAAAFDKIIDSLCWFAGR
jgi:hypothetical protein